MTSRDDYSFEVRRRKIPKYLFVQDHSGAPCCFALDIKEKEFQIKIQEWIRAGGGIVKDPRKLDPDDCFIRLIDPESRILPDKNEGDVFNANYVKDCANEEKLLSNLNEYKMNPRSIFEEYDPMMILRGHQKWCDLAKKLSAKIASPEKSQIIEEDSDFEDEVTLRKPIPVAPKVDDIRKKTLIKAASSTSSSSDFRKVKRTEAIKVAVEEKTRDQEAREKVETWLKESEARPEQNLSETLDSIRAGSTMGSNGKAGYTFREDKSILDDIIRNNGYNRLKGNEFWKECEMRGNACKGRRSWQSMKERFRKKILPVIHISFRKVLTKESLDNFEKYAKGLKVDTPPSTENSEDESIEREMNQVLAQSTPITSSERSTGGPSTFHNENKNDDDEDDEIRSDASTEIFAEMEFSTILTRKKSSEKSKVSSTLEKSEKNIENVQNVQNSTPTKPKKRALMSQKPKPASILSEELGTSKSTTIAMKRAREVYLSDPLPSTSKSKVKSPFKIPTVKLTKLPEKLNKDKDKSDNKSGSEDENDDPDDEETMSTVSKASSRGNPYKNSEDKKIIQWIIKQSRYSEIGGIKMWEILESCNEVPGRSYQSMKERFRKNILPNIQNYQLEKDQVDRFRMYSQGSKSKAKKKK